MHFDCTSEALAGSVVVTPSGEIDRDTAPRLREVLTAAAVDAVGAVEVELGQVTFLDSSGVGALLFGRDRANAAGATFRIRNPPETVQLVLQITNVWDLLIGD